jgi:hypothetical protein
MLRIQYEQPATTLPYTWMTPTHHEWTVAVAEDPFVRRYIGALLAKHGFQTAENDTRLTLRMMESGDLQPDVLITNDPGSFAGFAEEIPVVYVAAAPDPSLVRAFKSSRMLRKPFQAEELLQAVAELTEGVAA